MRCIVECRMLRLSDLRYEGVILSKTVGSNPFNTTFLLGESIITTDMLTVLRTRAERWTDESR